MLSAAEALARLQEGNEKFAAAVRAGGPLPCPALQPERMDAPQKPFAAILGCADSRVTPEWIFQQGIGDIFVVRVAGDVPAVPCEESLEFAVAHLGVRLIVVLGHTHCGAVKATLAELAEPSPGGPALPDTMGRIMPCLEKLHAEHPELEGDELEDAAIHADVRQTVQDLLDDSEILRAAVEAGDLEIVAAVYDMATGVVAYEEDAS